MTFTERVWLWSTVGALFLDFNITIFLNAFLVDAVQILVVVGVFHSGTLAITTVLTPLCRGVDRYTTRHQCGDVETLPTTD